MNTRSPFVQVFGQQELVARVARAEPVGSHLISIGNPLIPGQTPHEDETLPPEFAGKFQAVLRLEFFDVPSLANLRPEQPQRIPERRDVEAVLKFFRESRGEATGYTVHCWAGVSRSTAVALGILYLIHGTEEAAARELMAIRRVAGPHSGLVQFWDDVLGSHLAEANDVLRRERLLSMKREILASLRKSGVEVPEDLEELEELEELEDLGELK
ncbi:MAG: hypothetical protein WCG80_06685 [Spirochaetales bacterium]